MSKETSISPAGNEIARRLLHDAMGNSVELVMYAPRVDPQRSGDWTCRTEIVTKDDTRSFESTGSDSLQALSLGLSSLRFGLKQLGFGFKRLSWLEPGETGLPFVLQELDEDFQSLVESLVEVEQFRRAMWQKELRKTREGDR